MICRKGRPRGRCTSAVEIECEAPRFDYASLPPGEQARRAGEATRAFLARYCAARDKPMWE